MELHKHDREHSLTEDSCGSRSDDKNSRSRNAVISPELSASLAPKAPAQRFQTFRDGVIAFRSDLALRRQLIDQFRQDLRHCRAGLLLRHAELRSDPAQSRRTENLLELCRRNPHVGTGAHPGIRLSPETALAKFPEHLFQAAVLLE